MFSSLLQHRVLCFVAFMLIFHGAALAAEDQTPQPVQDLQKAAIECIKAKNIAGALDKYQDIIQAYPATKYALDAQRRIVTSHIDADGLSLAQTELMKMLSAYGNLAEDVDDALNHVIIAYNRKGHYQKAIENCRHLLKQWPDSDRALWAVSRQAQAQIMLGNLVEAETLINTLKTDYSKEKYFGGVLCNDIADSYIANSHSDKAVALWQSISQEFPAEAISKKRLASHYLKQDDLANAGSYIDQLMQNCDAKMVCDIFYGLANTYKKEHPEFCADLYRQMVAAWPQDKNSVEAQKRFITLQIKLGDMTAADTELVRFLELYGNSKDVVSRLREIKGCYWNRGQRNQAHQLCGEMLCRYPDDPKAILNQGDWICGALAMGDLDTAESGVETFFDKYTEPADVFLTQVARIQGRCLQKNDYSLAIDIGCRALEKYPTHENVIRIRQKLACAYLELGSKEQADAEVAAIIQTYSETSEFAGILNGIADAYRKSKDYAKSIGLYRAALSRAGTQMDIQLDAYAGMAKAAVWTEKTDKTEDVDAIVQRIVTDYPDAKRLGYHVFQIGEEYYFRAEHAMQNGISEQADSDFQKAVTIWQNNMNQINDPFHEAMATYFAGVACQSIKRFEEAADYYQKLADEFPDYDRRWHALSMVAQCYNILKNQGEVSKDVADEKMTKAYEQLAEDYPDLPASHVAKNWLKVNSDS